MGADREQRQAAARGQQLVPGQPGGPHRGAHCGGVQPLAYTTVEVHPQSAALGPPLHLSTSHPSHPFILPLPSLSPFPVFLSIHPGKALSGLPIGPHRTQHQIVGPEHQPWAPMVRGHLMSDETALEHMKNSVCVEDFPSNYIPHCFKFWSSFLEKWIYIIFFFPLLGFYYFLWVPSFWRNLRWKNHLDGFVCLFSSQSFSISLFLSIEFPPYFWKKEHNLFFLIFIFSFLHK